MDRACLLSTVVRPTLERLAIAPPAGRTLAEFRRAEAQLLMGTQAQESPDFDRRQIGGGPALGLWQMEAGPGRTHDDIWANFLAFHPELAERVAPGIRRKPWPEGGLLEWFDSYACAMARIQYLRAPEPLPAADDIGAMDRMYLRRYNAGGAARAGEFMEAYERHVAALFAAG